MRRKVISAILTWIGLSLVFGAGYATTLLPWWLLIALEVSIIGLACWWIFGKREVVK